MDDSKLDELKLSGALPSPSGVGLAILELTRRDDYCLGDLSSQIQADPALTGRILKLANTALTAGVDPVTNISEAVMRLGVKTVRNLALGFSLVSGNRNGYCKVFDYDGYWSSSLVAALSAQAFAHSFRSIVPADAFTCGLLSGIGKLALSSIHPERYVRVLDEARGKDSSEVVALERSHLDTDHRELGEALIVDWRLPAHFSFAVGNHESPELVAYAADEPSRQMANLLVLATRIAAVFFETEWQSEGDRRRQWVELESLRRTLDIEPAVFSDRLDGVVAAWREWCEALDLPTCDVPCFSKFVTAPLPVIPAAAAPRPIRRAIVSAAEEPDDVPIGELDLSQNEGEQVIERRGLRVLAVDDDPVSLRILTQHLTKDGHAVTQAKNGREALELSLGEQPQLIVTDWMMPEMDGIEFCRSLRLTPSGRGIYVLILTAREDEERIVEAFDAGADDYVVKPFNARILLARVRAGQRMIELREQVELDRRERARQLAEMAVLNRKLRAAALTDVLTELPNRRYAMKRLEQELARAQRSPTELSVMMLDIDYFKKVNDEYGHDVGDNVLRETGSVLRRMTRRGDVVCRLGGEEFLIICSNCGIEEARQSADRIREAIEEHEIAMGDEIRSITMSIGVAELGPGIDSVDALLKLSDRRVYEAKHRGRNRVVADDPEPGVEKRSA